MCFSLPVSEATCSTVLMGYTGMRREADDIAIGKSPGFRPLCTPTRDVFH